MSVLGLEETGKKGSAIPLLCGSCSQFSRKLRPRKRRLISLSLPVWLKYAHLFFYPFTGENLPVKAVGSRCCNHNSSETHGREGLIRSRLALCVKAFSKVHFKQQCPLK